MVYAENGEIVKENERKMMAAGMVGPEGHVLAHPEEAEVSRAKAFLPNAELSQSK